VPAPFGRETPLALDHRLRKALALLALTACIVDQAADAQHPLRSSHQKLPDGGVALIRASTCTAAIGIGRSFRCAGGPSRGVSCWSGVSTDRAGLAFPGLPEFLVVSPTMLPNPGRCPLSRRGSARIRRTVRTRLRNSSPKAGFAARLSLRRASTAPAALRQGWLDGRRLNHRSHGRHRASCGSPTADGFFVPQLGLAGGQHRACSAPIGLD